MEKESKPTESLQEMLEFYFSDSNLSKDRFMRQKIGENDEGCNSFLDFFSFHFLFFFFSFFLLSFLFSFSFFFSLSILFSFLFFFLFLFLFSFIFIFFLFLFLSFHFHFLFIFYSFFFYLFFFLFFSFLFFFPSFSFFLSFLFLFLFLFLFEPISKYNKIVIDISVFLKFNKVKSVTEKIEPLVEAIKSSTLLSLFENNGRYKVKRSTPIPEVLNFDKQTVYVVNFFPFLHFLWFD